MIEATESYKKIQVTESYDVIVIGSGISGLGLAAILSKEGKRVLVLEQHYTIGGFTHVFKRPEYEWDVGLHYIGKIDDPNEFNYQLFHHITNGKIEWEPMPDDFDKIIVKGKQYDIVAGREEFAEKMKEQFPTPEDHKSIDQYMELLLEAQQVFSMYFAERMLPKFWSKIFGGLMKKGFGKFAHRTTLSVLSEITSNKELIAVLTGQYGDYGVAPAESSFGIHCTIVNHYMEGACFPVGGSASIANYICPVIKEAGGLVLSNAEVAEIIVKKNTAVGVKMKDGKALFAPKIVSSAGAMNTYLRLLPPAIREKHNFKEKLRGLKPSVAHICLYIGIKDTAENLGLKKSNYWIYQHNDHDKAGADFLRNPLENDFPVVYISFPSVKDPTWEDRYPGKSTIEIITVAPYELFEQWEGERWKKRGDEYLQLKEKFSQKLLESLYSVAPNLRGKIDYYELSSPLSTKHFTNYEHGEIYGLAATPERFEHKFLRVVSPVKNLFLTGQDILCVGVMGALSSGVFTASILLKKNCMNSIKKTAKEELGILD